MNPVLNVEKLSHQYADAPTLRDVTFSLQAKERLALVGASGSGKTTLLRLIAGLETLTSGRITLNGQLASDAGQALIAPERRQVAFVFQGLALFPQLRALRQIAFAAKGHGGIERAKTLLEKIGLAHRADARLDELSGGERQRIALARAMAQEPRLILMDEPFASLDDQTRDEMRELLRTLLDQYQASLILVTHNHEDALDLAQRVLVLDHGKVVAQGSIQSVLMHPLHASAVRALGLGQIIQGRIDSDGFAQTLLGKIPVSSTAVGNASLLIRPAQLRIVRAGDAVAATVVALESRPPELTQIRTIAVVKIADTLLRVFVGENTVQVGQQVGIRVEGLCEIVNQ